MMYPYSQSYSIYYGGQVTFLVVAVLAAIILGVVLYFTFLSKKNEGKYKGVTEKIYNFFSFNKFYTEVIMKLLYIVTAAVLVVVGVVMLFTYSLVGGLLILVLGNILLRICYELIMMFIILCRKTVSVDKKLDKITDFYSDDFGYEDFSAVEAEDSQACDNCGSCEEACDGCESACDGCAETEDSAVTVEDSAEATEEHGADEKETNDDNIENIKTSDR